MFPRFRILTLLSLAALAGSAFSQPAPSTQQAPAREITPRGGLKLYKKMQTIKPGMTREQLLTVFTTEGGLSTRLQQTYVSRECPYFKMDVEFQAVGPTEP